MASPPTSDARVNQTRYARIFAARLERTAAERGRQVEGLGRAQPALEMPHGLEAEIDRVLALRDRLRPRGDERQLPAVDAKHRLAAVDGPGRAGLEIERQGRRRQQLAAVDHAEFLHRIRHDLARAAGHHAAPDVRQDQSARPSLHFCDFIGLFQSVLPDWLSKWLSKTNRLEPLTEAQLPTFSCSAMSGFTPILALHTTSPRSVLHSHQIPFPSLFRKSDDGSL